MLSIAAIDVGSNAIRLEIGEVSEAGKVAAVENIRLPVRLGEDVFSRGCLEEDVIRQLEDSFHRFQRVIEDAGVYTLRAVATSAMREASNGQAVIDRLYASTGICMEIIDSTEEARLIHKAVSRVMDIEGKRTLLVDIGGGSVEVSLADGKSIIFTDSFKIGSVRLMKAQEREDGKGESQAEWITERAEPARLEVEQAIGEKKVSMCVATGGSMDELGRMRQRLFKAESNRMITLEELKKMVNHLGGMSVNEIAQEFSLRPDRADVIYPATVVLQLMARPAHVRQVDFPNVSLKDGILYSIAEDLAHEPLPDRRGKLLESALKMGHKYNFDESHAVLIAKLARQLFNELALLHKLGENELLLLEVGALLHDIGHFINTIDHDKHGYYLLRVNHLIGLNHREQMIVANVVRFHRGRTFFKEEEDFKSLPSEDRRTILKLAAILSLADGMDMSRSGRIQDVRLVKAENGWRLALPSDMTMEKWTLSNKRKALFEDVFGTNLKVE